MFFRNLVLYRLPRDWSITAPDLEEALGQKPLQPCRGFDLQTRGWVHCGYEQRYLYTQGAQSLLALGVEQKILPASVVLQEARERAQVLEKEQGHPVGRRQMRELKARVADELRARALSRRRTTLAWLDPDRRLLAVNTAGAKRAEEFVETLRDTLGSLAVLPVSTTSAPASSMALWLTHGDAPGRFSIDQDLELQVADRRGSSIRYVHHPLEGREIRTHLAENKLPVRLGLVWNDRIAFILQQDLQLRRIQFLAVQSDGQANADNPNEQFDLDFALMTGELTQLVDELLAILGADAAVPPSQPRLAVA